MDFLSLAIGAIIGILLGSAAAAALFISKRSQLQSDLDTQRMRTQMLDQQLQQRSTEFEQLRAQLDAISTQRETALQKLAGQEEKLKAFETAEMRLKESFQAMGAQALKHNSDEFLKIARQQFETLLNSSKGDLDKKQQAIDSIVKPIRELLDKQNVKLTEIEKQREADKTGLQKHLELIAQAHEKLGRETGRLVNALRKSHHRGRWGELQLRNAVELAGMTNYCDFFEQRTADDSDSRLRPDMIVRLPGGGQIIVDSKVALEGYLNAIEPDADHDYSMQQHVRHIETHVRQLSQKAYWDQFEKTPQLVILFMPLESALTAALDRSPDLHTNAMKQHVLIATPTLLIALLRAVAYGWQQQALADNAREIAEQGRALYDRLSTFVRHLEKVGKNLDKSVGSFNDAVGSLERMVLPAARKLKELRATNEDEVDAPPIIEIESRDITSAELKPSLLESDHAATSPTHG